MEIVKYRNSKMDDIDNVVGCIKVKDFGKNKYTKKTIVLVSLETQGCIHADEYKNDTYYFTCKKNQEYIVKYKNNLISFFLQKSTVKFNKKKKIEYTPKVRFRFMKMKKTLLVSIAFSVVKISAPFVIAITFIGISVSLNFGANVNIEQKVDTSANWSWEIVYNAKANASCYICGNTIRYAGGDKFIHNYFGLMNNLKLVMNGNAEIENISIYTFVKGEESVLDINSPNSKTDIGFSQERINDGEKQISLLAGLSLKEEITAEMSLFLNEDEKAQEKNQRILRKR